MSKLWHFECKQSGVVVASGSTAHHNDALREAAHYAMMYAQDGPAVSVRVFQRSRRKPSSLNVPAAQTGVKGEARNHLKSQRGQP